MKWKSLFSTAFLGYHFLLRILKRIFFVKSAGLKDFLEFYREDRIAAISREEKDLFPGFSRCVSCGLCDALCPAIAPLSQENYLGPSFLAHLSRSIPDFAGHVPLNFDHCHNCHGCDSICPKRVPLREILEFIKNKSELYAVH